MISNQSFSDSIFFNDSLPEHKGTKRRTLTEFLSFGETTDGHNTISRNSNLDNLPINENLRSNTPSVSTTNLLAFVEIIVGKSNHSKASDALTFTEALTFRFSVRTIKVADSLSFTERSNRYENLSVTDPLTLTDSVTQKTKFFTNSEFLTFNESVNVRKSINRISIADTLPFTEHLKKHPFLFSLSDVLTLNETISQPTHKTRHTNDTLTFTDSLSRFTLRLTDSLTFTDSLAYSRGRKDTLTITDSLTFSKTRATQDVLIFTEYLCPNGLKTRAITDNLAFGERLIIRSTQPNNPNPGVPDPNGFNIPLNARKSGRDQLVVLERVKVIGGRILTECGWVDNQERLEPLIKESLIITDSLVFEIISTSDSLLTEAGDILITEASETLLLE